MRRKFDEELNKLNLDLTKMGHLVETALENTIDAFKNQDKNLAREIITNDRLINDMERNVESRSFRLIPVSYTHLTLPTTYWPCRSRWSPYH